MQIDIPLTQPQREFCFSIAPFPAIIGGLGSGKSRAGTFRLILKMLEDPGIDTAYYMPVYDLLKLRAIPGVEQDLEQLGIKYKVNKSDYSIQIEGYGKMIFRSYDRPERIIAYEVADSLVDEIDTLKKDDAAKVWRKVTERNRQKCKKGFNTIGCVTTPDSGINGFVYEKWGKNPSIGYELIKASTRSNPYLPEGYIQSIMDNYDPLLAEMYIEGEFVSLNKNKVYHFFDRNKHHTDLQIQPNDRLHVGIDFNIGGCCCIVAVLRDDKINVVDEFVAHDTYDIINKLNQYKNNLTLYPDSSGDSRTTNATATDIALLDKAGYQINAPRKNPFVRDRINSVNALISKDRFFIDVNKCQELVNALEVQGYDDRGDPEKFNSHPAIDDYVDALGYMVNQLFPVNREMFITGIQSVM